MIKLMAAALFLLVSTVPARAEQVMPEWLAGAWELQSDNGWGDEYWTPPRGGIMIGAGRTGKGEKLGTYESMRIAADENGTLAFWAMPKWTGLTKFPLARQTDSEIVFENAAHDYPQRIRYWREGKLLKAEISKIDGSGKQQFVFRVTGGR